MSGVMFVVHIPSARHEKMLRQRVNEELAKGNQASVEDEKRKDDKGGDGDGATKPFLTPQPERHLKEQNEDHRNSFLDLADPQQDQHSQPTLNVPSDGIPFIDVCDTDAVDLPKTPIAPDKEKEGGNGDSNPTGNSLAVPLDRSNALRKSWDGFKDILGSARRTKELQKETEKIQLSADSTLDVVMKEILRQKQIKTSAWVETNKGRGHQITFSIESGPRCDDVIYLLCSWGIGERYGSTISIASCTLFTEQQQEEEEEKQTAGAWNSFLTSARAQLNVASIVDSVKNGAVITFDYVTMLITAAIIAAFGLIEDSSVNLIASMLVSPLMGPILAAVFGTVIKDRNLQMLGIRNEAIAIGLVLFSGFCFGLIISSTDEKWGLGEGVTSEMLARCQTHSLNLGIAIALPSGAAVAVAILAENGGGLVGVAISASLLPPSVNAGILWSLSLLSSIYGKAPDQRYATVTQTNFYSDSQSVELFCLGCMSFCLTLINVCCIFVMGVFILWIKEVAPIIPKDQKQFWNHDIKIARDYNKTMHTMDGMTMNKQLLQELSHFRTHHGESDKQGSERWLNTIGRAGQNTWSPRHAHNTREHRPTIQELEALYLSLSANTGDSSGHHYPSHHAAHQFMKIPSSYLRSSKPWSPPKFSSAETEPLSPGGHPIRSKPIDIGFRRHHRLSDSFRATSAPLSKILENVGEGTSSRHHSQKNKNKFIVTPAVDPIHK